MQYTDLIAVLIEGVHELEDSIQQLKEGELKRAQKEDGEVCVELLETVELLKQRVIRLEMENASLEEKLESKK